MKFYINCATGLNCLRGGNDLFYLFLLFSCYYLSKLGTSYRYFSIELIGDIFSSILIKCNENPRVLSTIDL